jgi:uncharacterized membrane protein
VRHAPAIALLGLFAVAAPAAGTDYVLIELVPRDGADTSGAGDVNNDGLAVGASEYHPILWRNGVPITLPFTGSFGSASEINEVGHVVGTVSQRATLWTGGPVEWTATDLGSFSPGGVSWGRGFNNLDVVVGTGSGGGYVDWAFVWDDVHGFQPLPGLDEQFHFLSVATDINDAGQVAGWYPCFDQGCSGFLWDAGTLIELPFVEAYGINNAGQVFGVFRDCYENDCGPSSPRTWQDGVERVLLFPGGTNTAFAYGSNDLGHVVGVAGIHSAGGGLDAPRAVLWVNTIPTDLNNLLPAESPWDLLSARGINEHGAIVGLARSPVGHNRGFMLVPRPACHADLDDSGDVGFADLLALIGAWGPCTPGPGCLEDLDDDGEVDFADVLALIAEWGRCR